MALKTEKIKEIYAVYFLFIFAWTILFQFISVLAIQKFFFTNSDIGDMAVFMGICWAIGSGYLNKIFTARFSSNHILEYCLIGFTILCGLVYLPNQIWALLLIVGISVLLGGLAWPICTGLISSLAPAQMQGKLLGVSQSTQSFAMTLAPIIGGMAFHVSLELPFLIAAITSLSSALLYYFTLKNR